MPYLIRTKSEIFLCTDEGYLYREGRCCTSPNSQWRLVCLVRRDNLGRVVQTSPGAGATLREWLTGVDAWTFKNGKPRYRVRDYDHGTYREWGEGVLEVQYVEKL